MKQTLYYIYFDKKSKSYEIYSTTEKLLLGEYAYKSEDYYFACFTRLLDAQRYILSQNKELHLY